MYLYLRSWNLCHWKFCISFWCRFLSHTLNLTIFFKDTFKDLSATERLAKTCQSSLSELLCSKNALWFFKGGFPAFVTGWGYLSQNPIIETDELRVLAVQVVDLPNCKKLSSKSQNPDFQILSYHICASAPNTFDKRPCLVSITFQECIRLIAICSSQL